MHGESESASDDKGEPMSKRILDHLRSNVIGYLALFLTLSMGTAYATHQGGANTISSGDIIEGEVKNSDVGANAVTGDKVLNRSINFGDIAADAIFSGHIATGNVQSIDVRNNDLTGVDIADTSSLGGAEINEGGLAAGGDLFGSLANAQLGPSSIDAQSLAADSVDGQKIKDDAVDNQDIKSDAVDSSEIADSAVKAPDIATASVNTDELAPSSVDGQKISDDAVDKEDIKSGAVESSEIADDAVKAQEIDTAAVGSGEIAPNAVGTSELGALPAGIVCCPTPRDDGRVPVPSETPVVLEWQMPLVDTGGVYPGSIQGPPTRLVAPVAGLYQVAAKLYWEPDSTPSGFREVAIRCNTTTGTGCQIAGNQYLDLIVAHEREPAHGFETGIGLAQPGMQVASISALVPLRAGDYAEVLVYQNSGEEQAIAGRNLATMSPTFSLAWVAPTS
jgi:hypothetical protein